MKRLVVFALCAAALVGCNNSPEKKIENAQEKQIDAKAELKSDVATNQSAKEIQSDQKAVVEANKDMAETQAEVAKDKADAQEKLGKKVADLEERITKVKAKPAPTDPQKASEFTQTLALIDQKAADARAKVTEFAAVSPTEWKGPYENANNAIAALDEAVDKAE